MSPTLRTHQRHVADVAFARSHRRRRQGPLGRSIRCSAASPGFGPRPAIKLVRHVVPVVAQRVPLPGHDEHGGQDHNEAKAYLKRMDHEPNRTRMRFSRVGDSWGVSVVGAGSCVMASWQVHQRGRLVPHRVVLPDILVILPAEDPHRVDAEGEEPQDFRLVRAVVTHAHGERVAFSAGTSPRIS